MNMKKTIIIIITAIMFASCTTKEQRENFAKIKARQVEILGETWQVEKCENGKANITNLTKFEIFMLDSIAKQRLIDCYDNTTSWDTTYNMTTYTFDITNDYVSIYTSFYGVESSRTLFNFLNKDFKQIIDKLK
jgi:hypothetical protein